MPLSLPARDSPSATKAAQNRINGKLGGRPKGALGKYTIQAREIMADHGPLVAAEMIRLALHAKMEPVRAAACRDVLAYAWGRPLPVDNGDGGVPGQITVINVITGVRGG